MPDDPKGAKSEETNTEYANNTFFEGTVWDLKILFGEWSARANEVTWHTSMTVPWAQAKLMAFYLAVNVAAHEIEHDTKVKIPVGMLPPEVPPATDQDTPMTKALRQMFREQREKFLSSL